jgi:ATP-dependent Clp protease ATP-binding subunit ClpA
MRLLGRRRPTPRYMDGAVPYLGAAASVSRQFHHMYIGTEHVLLALAEDSGGAPARVLEQRGLSAAGIRAELVSMVGVGQRPAGDLDGDALATLGIDLDEIRRKVEQEFGPGALERAAMSAGDESTIGNPYRCIAPRLKRAFEIAAREARGCPMSPSEVLIGLASVEDCLAARILRAHGITLDQLRTALGGDDPGPLAA